MSPDSMYIVVAEDSAPNRRILVHLLKNKEWYDKIMGEQQAIFNENKQASMESPSTLRFDEIHGKMPLFEQVFKEVLRLHHPFFQLSRSVQKDSVFEGKVIPATFYPEMLKAVDYKTGQPAETGYGLANFVWPSPHGFHFGHAGIFPGHLTRVDYVKEHHFSIALQYNTDQGLGRTMGKWLNTWSELVIQSLDNK